MVGSTYTPQFQSIELKRTPWTRFAGSLAVNAGFVVVFLLIPVTVTHNLQPERQINATTLIAPPPLTHFEPAPRPQITKRVVVPVPPPVKPVRKDFHAPPVKAEVPKTVNLPAAPLEAPKPVEVASFEAPKIQLPQRDVLPPVNAPPPNPAPVKAVKTGGFGDPNGVPANPSATKESKLAQVGAFDLSPGTGRGAGSGSNGRTQVASAGFGDAAAVNGTSGTGGTGHGTVHAGGFGDYDTSSHPAQPTATRPATPAETPVEITYKPKPAYTPEAREKKIEGDVQLEVLFSSAGQIQVLRLIRGLGYGLDENARQAASQIRFRPGTRNGTPVDVTGTVHIIFQIS